MMRYIAVIFCLFFMLPVWADEKLDQMLEHLELAEAPINRSDMKSVERGAKFFATNCMSCHTLIYLKYNKLAENAGITIEKMPINVKEWPFGVKPPDLSSEADIRGVNWIYTYLHSFYIDASRPTGVNNLLFPNTAMPAIVAPYQGEQKLLADSKINRGGILFGDMQYYDMLVQTKAGTMSPEEFDATIADLVNFLAYAAEPYYEEQRRIGFWVLGFLVILFIFCYLLKKEYWKDVKTRRWEDDV